MHTRRPFSQATQREAADEVAVLHYEWIKASLVNAGVDPSPFNIAMAWNTGVNNVINGRAPSVSYNYAERVVNLVQTFKRQQRAAAVAKAEPVAEAPKAVPAVFKPSLDQPMITLSLVPDAPKFEVVVAPPAPLPTVYTNREEPAEKPLFVVATTATLTPRFTLFPSLAD